MIAMSGISPASKKRRQKVSRAVTESLSATSAFYKSGFIVISVNDVISKPHHSHTEYRARPLWFYILEETNNPFSI